MNAAISSRIAVPESARGAIQCFLVWKTIFSPDISRGSDSSTGNPPPAPKAPNGRVCAVDATAALRSRTWRPPPSGEGRQQSGSRSVQRAGTPRRLERRHRSVLRVIRSQAVPVTFPRVCGLGGPRLEAGRRKCSTCGDDEAKVLGAHVRELLVRHHLAIVKDD